MKQCSKCKNIKSLGDFYKDRSTTDGYKFSCKTCISSYWKEYYSKNTEILVERTKKWYSENLDKVKKRQQNYNKEYYLKNQENVKKLNLEYYKKNKEKILARQGEYEKHSALTNPNFRIARSLRDRVRKAINNIQKTGSAVKDLGCTVEELKKHLESKFQPGMSWDNYGEWHIDHIKPLSKFDLQNREKFCQACHYSNLQPLWAIDNIKKGNR